MNRRQKEVPTLEDALAKGFAVMQGEEEEPSKTPPLSNLESEDSVETVTQSKPDYRPPTQAVEHRTTFTVGPSSNPQTLVTTNPQSRKAMPLKCWRNRVLQLVMILMLNGNFDTGTYQ